MKSIQKLKEMVESNLKSEISEEVLTALTKLENYKKLETEGKLVEFPCKVGDYVEFTNGNILPVVYLTKCNNGDINVGCQNGYIISMKLQSYWVKRFISKEEYQTKMK